MFHSLLKAARLAFRGDLAACKETVSGILSQHVQGTSILSSAQAERLVGIFTEECDRLATTLSNIAQQPSLSRKHSARAELEDQVLGVGEKFSTLFLTAMLEDRGRLAEYIDLSHVVDANPHQALTPDFYQHISESIGRIVQACGDRIPVITGFFGKVPGGLLESCGRGYSDLLAALVAVGVDARELQIWKEVSGVYTADPRKVPTAYLLPSIHPSEANELTFYGSEVLHHFTIEQCIPRIPIRIKNVREPDGSGTLIFLDDQKKDDPYYDQRPRRPTAVTVKQHITVVNVHSNRKVGSPEFLAKICGKLSEHSLSVDLFELNECHVSLAVHSRSAFITMTGKKNQEEIESQHLNLLNAIEDLKKFGSVEVVHNMAILSLIGKGLKRSCGMAGRLFSALGDNNINIEMISQGASEVRTPFHPWSSFALTSI